MLSLLSLGYLLNNFGKVTVFTFAYNNEMLQKVFNSKQAELVVLDDPYMSFRKRTSIAPPSRSKSSRNEKLIGKDLNGVHDVCRFNYRRKIRVKIVKQFNFLTGVILRMFRVIC